MSKLKRETKETRIVTSVTVGAGKANVNVRVTNADGSTEATFLRHMIETLARYAALDIEVEATGDLKHHLVEDVAITLGLALKDEVPASAARYGWAQIPMDEALAEAVFSLEDREQMPEAAVTAEAAVDLGGRPYYVGKLPSQMYTHFLHSFATNLGATLHVRVLRGDDKHHMVEAAIKATGMAIRQALVDGGGTVFSTKGSVNVERLD